MACANLDPPINSQNLISCIRLDHAFYVVKAGDKATPKHTISIGVGRLFDWGTHVRTLAQANYMHKNTGSLGGRPSGKFVK